jgi:phage FluMu protein Com
MRTPDETAGRKGRCPNCQIKVQIPLASVKTSDDGQDSQGPAQPAATPQQPAAPGQPSGTIQFKCGQCEKSLTIPAANAGKKGKCPHCGALMSIPRNTRAPAPKSQPAAAESDRWKAAPTTKPTAAHTPIRAKIEFHCSGCQKIVRVAETAAGQMGQCPNCKSVIKIPLQSTTSPSGLTPLGGTPTPASLPAASPATAGLTPLDSGGLTPLDDSGLAPLDNLSPMEGTGLVPLGDNSTLDPLNLGNASTPPAGSQNPFTGQSNPYQTPATPYPAAAVQRKQSGTRSGVQIATMVCAGFLIFYAAGQLVLTTVMLAVQGTAMIQQMGVNVPEGQDAAAFEAGAKIGFYGAMVVVYIFLALTIAGAIQMMRFKTWGLCLTSCILTLMPCNCPICFGGLILGVWGITMLCLPNVRSAFR